MLHFISNVFCVIVFAIMVIDMVDTVVPVKFWNHKKQFSKEKQFKLHLLFIAISIMNGWYLLALLWAVSCYNEYNKLKAAGVSVKLW